LTSASQHFACITLISLNLFPSNTTLSFWTRKQSHGAKSDEGELWNVLECASTIVLLFLTADRVQIWQQYNACSDCHSKGSRLTNIHSQHVHNFMSSVSFICNMSFFNWSTLSTFFFFGFPAHIIHDLKKKLITKKQKHDTIAIQQNKKWVTFTYHSPLIRKIYNLFKQTNLNIALWATNTVHQQLTEKPTHKNPSGVYQLKCNTCNNAYIGESGRSITVRHKEHACYVRTNNPTSAYALHILNNKHEYGTAAKTLELLKPCHKGTHMNCWETFYMQIFHQHKLLINEQNISDTNPIYELTDM
jgi:hypothetical protein